MSSRGSNPPRRTRRSAIGYVRVSSPGRQEENCSLETQDAGIRDYCDREGLELVAVYEEAETAIEEALGARPVLSDVRNRLREGEADTLVVFKVDRVFRNQYQPAHLLPELRLNGCGLEFVKERFEDTPIGRFALNAMAFAAELEAVAIAERTMRGRLDSLTKHGWLPPAPKPLYGYRFVKGPNRHGDEIIVGYEEDAATAHVVRRIYADYLAGGTLRGLATALTREGVTAPSGRSNPWSYVTVRDRLTNPRYAGEARGWRHERRRTKHGKKGWRFRPEEEQHALPPGTIPPLVTRDDWEAVQRRLPENRATSARNNPAPEATLLRGGLVRCAYCRRQDDPEEGRVMVVANANRHRGATYRCVAVLPDGRQCTNTITVAVLDRLIWEHVKALLAQPEHVREHFRAVAQADPTTGEVAGIEAALRQSRREQENLTAALGELNAEARAGVVALLNRKAAEVASLERSRDAILGRRAVWAEQRERMAAAEAQVRTLAEALGAGGEVGLLADALPTAKRQELVRALGLAVEVRRPAEPYPNGLRVALTQTLAGTTPGHCVKNGLPFRSQWSLGAPLVLRWADHAPLGVPA
jgi:DNA invertase Pin-like site-specific DNA recombinase